MTRSPLMVAGTVTLMFCGGATGAVAQGVEVGGEGSEYLLGDTLTAQVDTTFAYGWVSDRSYFGDWDGNATDTPAVRRGATYCIRNVNAGGTADLAITYGRPDDETLVGDWDGDGVDTLAVRRGSTYYVKNTLAGGSADLVFSYGRADDVVLVGDWDGDGEDTLAVRRDSVYYVKNTLAGGSADLVFTYGRPTDKVLVGDWDSDGDDTLAVRRDVTNYLKNSLAGGEADLVFDFGRTTDTAFSGDWNGDAADTFGLRRPPAVNCAVAACVALTFDDGPSAYTERLIDTLTTLDVPATFFVVGSQVDSRPSTVRRQEAEGFAVENHTYSHPQLDLLSYSAQLAEVQRADDALASAGVERSTLLRPPYGSWDSNTRLLGKPIILWSVDPRDWDGRTASEIRSHVTNYTTTGAIVLMHDSVSATVDAVPGIVADLRAKGFTLVTVETLVPWMEPGDIVYSRGQVVDASTTLDPSLATLSAPDGPTLGPVVDEAPFRPSN